MAREYARINIPIWQDDDWRALPAPAQHLYFVLWTHPLLTYAGVVDWRPGRLAAMASGWSSDEVQAAADCLEARLFIVVDTDTEECLVRSFVRFDGLMKQPRMAVSFANAFAAVASPDVRGVIVHEALKLRKLDPDLPGWTRPQVVDLLERASLDPRTRTLPTDPFGDGFTHGFGHGFTPTQGETLPSVRGRVSVPPTPAPAPTPTPERKEGAASRGTRLPADFTITPAMRTWATEHTPGLNLDIATEEFADYWRAVPGSKGVKLDWTATWRNDMRRKAERPIGRPGTPTRPAGPPRDQLSW